MSSTGANPIAVLLDLAQRARAAASVEELAFLLVNDTKVFLPYRQAFLWFEHGGVKTISGVIQPEANAPFTQFVESLGHALLAELPHYQPAQLFYVDEIEASLTEDWRAWIPNTGRWIPLEDPVHGRGGLILVGDNSLEAVDTKFVEEWVQIWLHAWKALVRKPAFSWQRLKQKLLDWWHQSHLEAPPAKWWERRPAQVLIGILIVLCFPVRLSVLASGELVPANPAVIRAPLDGVIGQFLVRPNQTVKAGEVLFTFDEGPIASRLEVARQALATAEAEYRQIAQIALTDSKSKGQLAVLLGKIGEKRAEAEFLESQFERAKVTAPQDGIAIFDDPTEWIGKPVQTGERVMRVANPADVEIEAWVPIGDAIPLPDKADVSLYLAASPFFSVNGLVRYIGHDAVPRPDGVYAYRLRATLTGSTDHRVGLKGTAKVYGGWVPFSYWVIRRPLALIRQYLAI